MSWLHSISFWAAMSVIFLIPHSRNRYFLDRHLRAINCKLLALSKKFINFEAASNNNPMIRLYFCLDLFFRRSEIFMIFKSSCNCLIKMGLLLSIWRILISIRMFLSLETKVTKKKRLTVLPVIFVPINTVIRKIKQTRINISLAKKPFLN
jgi:hypothetical protein